MQLKTITLVLIVIAAIGALCQQSTNTTSKPVDNPMENKELATFGAVHLNVTDLQRSVAFWKENIGMKVRNTTSEYTELGTNKSTLVVLYPTAKKSFKNGYSGLYHLAIHPSNEGEFARILARLITNRYEISPTDHTFSKAIYMEDPDGITVEITLETPERMDRLVMNEGPPKVIDRDGTVRSPSDALDVEAVLKALPDSDITKGLPDDTKIGHVHLYVSNLDAANQFYKNLGFLQFNYYPKFSMADLGAGGSFQHRIALNTWQSLNKPQAPEGTAGMKYYTIIFDSADRLENALKTITNYQQVKDGYLVSDPAGNKILLTEEKNNGNVMNN